MASGPPHTTYSALHLGGVVRPKGGVVTRRYEIVYIFDSTVEEAQVDQTLERFHTLLKSEENPELFHAK